LVTEAWLPWNECFYETIEFMREHPDTAKATSVHIEPSFFEHVFTHLAYPALILQSDGSIRFSNRAFDDLMQACGEAVSKDVRLFDLVVDSDREKISEAMHALNASTNAHAVQVRLSCAENQTQRIEISFTKVPGSSLLLATFYELPESLWSQKDIQRKTAELENLFYLMSHNMKSPIVSIQGYTNLLLENPDELSREDLLHYFERIKKNASRLNMMVQDLLEFSRISKESQRFEEVSMSDIFSNIYTESYFRIKQKGITLKAPEELPTIVADRQGMQTVLANLFDNAIKYMGDTKRPEIEVGWADKGRFHVFWVKDNGAGIPAKFHESVFNPFERANVSNQIEGTGVGLAIVKRIVQKHGGLVKVSSKVRKGSTFYFTIPKYSQHWEKSDDVR